MPEDLLPPPQKSLEDRIVAKRNPGRTDVRRALANARSLASLSSTPAPLPPAWDPPIGRIDLSRLTAAPPLHRPTVNGAGASRTVRHVGGGVQPPASSAIGLSDGTRISFAEVEQIPVLEYA